MLHDQRCQLVHEIIPKPQSNLGQGSCKSCLQFPPCPDPNSVQVIGTFRVKFCRPGEQHHVEKDAIHHPKKYYEQMGQLHGVEVLHACVRRNNLDAWNRRGEDGKDSESRA